MIIVVMGVAGVGKTTVGARLAATLNCPFLDADSLHPRSNVEKMARGVPLTDADRAPWLAAIHARLLHEFRQRRDLVVACSALTEKSRAMLAESVAITWVWLSGPFALIRSRLERRGGHYLKAEMLASQFEALEEPADAIVVDIAAPPAAIVERIVGDLRGRDARITTGDGEKAT